MLYANLFYPYKYFTKLQIHTYVWFYNEKLGFNKHMNQYKICFLNFRIYML